MLKFIKDKQSFQGKILLVCGISAGSVPTFALDNLITLNGFKRVAFFQSKFLEPSVGYLPKDIEDGALGLPAQVYLSGDVAVLQFRSHVRFGRKKDLAQEISNFVKTEKIADTIVLASLPFAIRHDRQIQSLQKNIYCKLKGSLGQRIMIEKCIELGLVRPVEELKDEDQKQEIILNHAGIANALLKQIDNLLVLLMFNEEMEDKQTGTYFSTQIYKVVDQKEVSIVR